MERKVMRKNIFANKDFKQLFLAAVLICIILIFSIQIIPLIMANDYKKQIIAHDYAISGYLSENFITEDENTLQKADIPKLLFQSHFYMV